LDYNNIKTTYFLTLYFKSNSPKPEFKLSDLDLTVQIV